MFLVLIESNRVRSYNNSMFVYTTLLRQLSAKHDDSTLASACLELEHLRDELVKLDDINDVNVGGVRGALDILSISIFNFKIIIANRGYRELGPVCDEMVSFFDQVKGDLDSAEQKVLQEVPA